MNEELCGACRWWLVQDVDAGSGECRRHAPAPLAGIGTPAAVNTVWPTTRRTEFCGDFAGA
jgi:hypothetical protein